MSTKILQIIPTPPNCTDGIGDFALLLAERLFKDYQIATHFLVFRTDIKVESTISGFPVTCLTSHNTQAFLSALPEDFTAIILQFSGFPYFQTNFCGMFGVGTPFWLVEALEKALNSRQLKLIAMFHELPKLYWRQRYFFDFLNPIHCHVSRQIAELTNVTIATSSKYQQILASWLKQPVNRIAIPSNMGEPDSVPPLTKRQRRLIIFGGSARTRVYKNAFAELIQCCQSLKIKEIYDVGPCLNLKERYDFQGLKFHELGFKTKEEISQLMLSSIAGIFDYTPFPGDLAKSGVLAAYCAHGLVPITTQYNPSEADGLHMNQHYLTLNNSVGQSNSNKLQAIADNAHNWYLAHSLPEITKVFNNYIQ
jgi:hypothetical protein